MVMLPEERTSPHCHNCDTTEFAPSYTLRMRNGCVLIEGNSDAIAPCLPISSYAR